MANKSESIFAAVTHLPDVAPEAVKTLDGIAIRTVQDLAQSPLFVLALELSQAASKPGHTLRRFGVPPGRLTKTFAAKPVESIADAPLSAFKDISEQQAKQLTTALGVRTVRDLALWPPFLQARELLAEAIREGLVSGKGKIYRVSGVVVRKDGSPVVSAEVKFERQGLRKTTPLPKPNTATTNANGGYIFEYPQPATSVDLRVELIADAANNVGATKPRVISNAGDNERVDFVVGDETFRGPSAFEQFERALDQAMVDDGLKAFEVSDFDKEALARLALKAGIDPRTLVLLRQSYILAKDTGFPAEIFFGMGLQKMPLGIPALLVVDSEKRRAAVEAALKANQISTRLDKDAARMLSNLDDLTILEALKNPSAPDKTTLGSLLTIAALPNAKQRKLAETYAKHSGTDAEFWKEVRTNGTLTDVELSKVQFVLQLGAVTQNHAPLVSALMARGVGDVKALAALNKADWKSLITGNVGGQSVGLPGHLTAAGLKEEDYADVIFRMVEDALPTAMIVSNIDRLSNFAPLGAFFQRNPDFDLRSTPVSTYLSAHANSLSFAANDNERNEIEKQLKSLERVYRVAPPGSRIETMEVLLKGKVNSAQKIRVLGRSAFMRRFGAALGTERARKVWVRANNASALAATLIARHGAAFDLVPIAVLPKRVDKLAKLPAYAEMFGSLDFCSCEHCLSVFGPAAYLVDVLHWLDNRVATSGTALDVLFSDRRADIGGIELSCANTNTALLYIDLVNEVLELTVAPLAATPAYQTTGNSTDLRAHPEHLHKIAYDVLAGGLSGGKDAIYPFNLPFNLWIEEARTYLGQLGVSRHQLMERLQGVVAARGDAVVGAETLGLSPLEWDVIVGEADPTRSVAAFWGLPGDPNLQIKLEKVSTLLERATPSIAEHGMEYDELTELLRTDFVQQPAPMGVWFNGQTCDTTKAQLVGLSEASLERMHRFIRLRRRLKCSTADLDRAIVILGGGKLDSACLLKISHAWRLAADLHLPIGELLGWWGSLDTRRWTSRLKRGKPAGVAPDASGFGLVFDKILSAQPTTGEDASPYDRAFQSASTTAEPNIIFGVHLDGDALADETQNLDDHLPSLSGALGITGDDFADLSPLLPDGKLTLSNLSRLNRHVSLARVLGLKVSELVSLLALTGIAPFDVTHTENAIAFVEEVRAIVKSGFTVAELDYLMRHKDTKPATLEPDDADIGVLFFELGNALRKIDINHPAPPASAIEALRTQLATDLAILLPSTDAGEALAIVDVDTQAGGIVPPGAETFINDKLKGIFDPADTKKKLVDPLDPAFLKDLQDRFDYALKVLVSHLKSSTVIEKIASTAGVDLPAATLLLRKHLKHPNASGRPLLAVFSADAISTFTKTEPDSNEPSLPGPEDLPDQFAAYKRFQKAAIILNRLKIRKEELEWVLERGPAQGTLDFQSLPHESNPTTIPYAGWARLRDAVALRDRFSPRAVFDLFEAARAAELAGSATAIAAAHEILLIELERRSRWEKTDIEFLVGTPLRPGSAATLGALGFAYPADWKDERPLSRLAEVMAIVRRVGLPAATLWPWRNIPDSGPGISAQEAIDLQQAQASEIKEAVRARHEVSQWREIAAKLRDTLRERQRDALVGWLVGNDPRFPDASAIFEHLLLDVEMSPCQLTSRIKQAISSTQLFIQRVLMGLEVDTSGVPTITFEKSDSDEWDWIKNYRVWEANRKVFLYPENWIEPELRDDKTPFFEALESELLQKENTAESAEQAFRSYLGKLDQVARLEVVGLFHQKDDGADVLHVFGRTRGTPAIYFYRQRINKSYWTPWEKVEVDIEGDHLIPYVFNRQLYIFWALITESALEKDPQQISASPAQPPQPERPSRYYQIRLAWSMRQGENWSPKKIAKPYVGEHVKELVEAGRKEIPNELIASPRSRPSHFFFRAYEEGGDLMVEPIRFYKIADGVMLLPQLDADGVPTNDPDVEANPTDDNPDGDGQGANAGLESIITGYYRVDRFRISGCDGSIALSETSSSEIIVHTPNGTGTENQTFKTKRSNVKLELPVQAASLISYQRLLDKPSNSFEIIPQRLDQVFQEGVPFFFQDRLRTFFISPRSIPWIRQPPEWSNPSSVTLEVSRAAEPHSELPGRSPVDPWIYDFSSIAKRPDAVSVKEPSESRLTALAGLGRKSLRDVFGARLTFVGDEAIGHNRNEIAIGVRARVVDVDGSTLSTVRFGSPPAVARGFQQFLIDREFIIPGLLVDSGPLSPSLQPEASLRYRFDTFYHPYVCTMLRQLGRFGLSGMLDPDPAGPEPLLRRQEKNEDFFVGQYGPRGAVVQPFPVDSFDFSYGGAYSIYNWEMFFHVPFLIACNLSKNQRFAEAQRWFHYIFDPTETDGPAPQRFWKVKPFFDLFQDENSAKGPIHELLLLLQYDGSEPEKIRQRDEFIEQVAQWRANPFSPHALARLRLAAYARAVVIKYIDNLIEWGDQLFRRDTMESINEATQLYILAAQILGRRPRRVAIESVAPKTFNDLRGDLDQFSNALVEEVEGHLPDISETESDVYHDDVAVVGSSLFFCLPPNEKLLTDYWDRVADRLFKLRHCMNIAGVVRQLALFEPPIDPALLVRAKALGMDLASALSDLNAALPLYKYQTLAQKATELCGDVRALGQAILSTYEKRDTEELTLLRAGHELKLQNSLIDVRNKQIHEAKQTLEGLQKSKESAEIRRDYYRSRSFMNAAETMQVALSVRATLLEAGAQIALLLGSVVGGMPDLTAGGAGFGGSPVATATAGGTQLSNSASSSAEAMRVLASLDERGAQLAGLFGGYQRRSEDWGLQTDLAEKEIETLERQVLGAEIRVAIAEKELSNLNLQLDQSREAEEFLKNKYTNDQLYQWMSGQLSSIYFQSYQLAYDMAKKAERAWQFELANRTKGFVQFGYWDSLKKGLLAGDKLHHDLKRMEVAYLDENVREFEITKHISLVQLDPLAFAQLRQNGSCTVDIPEVLFDLDYPGHFLRRVKSVSISIPCVTGPYSGISCTLTLLSSLVRHDSAPGSSYRRVSGDPRFTDTFGGVHSIVTSGGQNDSGLFETNLRDERYLPFEGMGAISEWRLELPNEFRSFDYNTIADVVFHIRYTARNGGEPLKQAAISELQDAVNGFARSEGQQGLARLFSLRHEFASEWHRFLNPQSSNAVNNTVTLGLTKQRFPFLFKEKSLEIKGITILVKVSPDFLGTHNLSTLKVTIETGDTAPSPASHISSDLLSLADKGLLQGEKVFNNAPGIWTMNMWLNDGDLIDPSAIVDILLLANYTIS